MSKKYRLAVVIGIAATALATALFFGGGVDEAQAQAPSTPGEAVVVLGGSLDRAVDLAFETPDAWAYDPEARQIHPASVELVYPVRVSDAAWLSLLSRDEYYILRQQGTERAFTHELNNNKVAGIYYSRATGQPLFRSEDKYDSGTGWPSFTRPVNANAIVYVEDNSLWSRRIEVVDSLSGSHLGHVFPDGPLPTRQRYCVNGASLVFVPYGEEPPALLAELRKLASER